MATQTHQVEGNSTVKTLSKTENLKLTFKASKTGG